MAEIPTLDAEETSDGRNRRFSSDDLAVSDSDGTSHEYRYARDHQRAKSAEPRLIQETNISDDLQTDRDSGSMGTYLVVPSQGQTLKTTTDDKRRPSFVFSHSQKKLSVDQVPMSPIISETAIDIQTSAASSDSDQPPSSDFQLLENVLQQNSSPGIRDGIVASQQKASVANIADNDCSSGTEATWQPCALSDEVPDSAAANERLFRVCEEHVAQQRRVSVEREQCVTKEKAAMSVVKGQNATSRHHRAVTVSRSQTWSFRDKTKSDQLLKDAGNAGTQDGKQSGSIEQLLLDEASARDSDLTVNSHSSAGRSKTLPHMRRCQAGKPLSYSLEEPPVSSAVQSCLLRDYGKDKEWSSVPWTDKSETQ